MKKLRTRKHAVVLNRSAGGDAFISVMLTFMGVFMFLPVWYLIVTAFKPLGERNITPPNFYVIKPTLQNFIDDYIKTHPGVKCDYIHGENTTRDLAKDAHTVGFVFDGMDKMELFPYVEAHGTLPRKTFSMGEAESKRYYLEMREIR